MASKALQKPVDAFNPQDGILPTLEINNAPVSLRTRILTMAYGSKELRWQGRTLYCRSIRMAAVFADKDYSNLFRVQTYFDDQVSDMVNLTRARDAAVSLTLQFLNGEGQWQKTSGSK